MPGVTSRGRGRRAMNEINMVPFIDVMLVLLIIFMVTAPLITTVIDVPTVGAGKQAADRVVYVEIKRDESVALRVAGGDDAAGAQRVPKGQLAARVKELQRGDADMPVVISAHRQVTYDVVMNTMDALQKAGVKRVGLLVKQGDRERRP
jgi:biopolymer transport protein TolR